MNRRSVTVFFMMLVALFFLATSNYAQDFVRSEEIPIPETDLNNGGTGNMIAGVDLDNDGKLEIYVVNDNWNDTPTEVIPRIYKLERDGGEWQVVWQAIPPIPKQNTWPPLVLADLDNDGKAELVWGVINNFTDTSVNPARVLVYEVKGDGSDELGVSDGAGNFLPNSDWTITSENSINIRPSRFAVADIDEDTVDELIFSDRAGSSGKFYFGVASVDNIPDTGDGSETWTLETSGKDFTLGANIQNKWDVAVIGNHFYVFDEEEISKVSWIADEFQWKYESLSPLAGGIAFVSAQVVDLDNDGKEEILAGEYYYGSPTRHVVLLQEDADTLKHTPLATVPDGVRIFGSACGDIDQDGYLDYVFGTRAGSPDGALHRLAYRGGDITNPASYELTTIDSLYFVGGYTNVIDMANMDDDPELEVLYTSSVPAGEFPNDGTLPIVVLDYAGQAGIAFDELIIAPEVQFQGAAPTGFRFKPGRILDNGKTIWFMGDNRNGVVAESYVWRSVDGGQTFTHNENPLPNFAGQMDAFNADVALIALVDGTIYRTKDGGVTWEEVYVYTLEGGDAWFDGVRVLSDNVAVAVGDGLADGSMHFVITEDQGETWNEVLTCNYLGAAYAYYTWGGAASSVGQSMWVGATPTSYVGSYVFRTNDAGLTWDSFAIPADVIPSYPRSIAFANLNEGMIADRRGNAVASDDGGATWYKSNRPDTSADSWINGVVAIPGTSIIMGMDDLGVYATSNLGDSWTKLNSPADLPPDSYFTAGLFHSTKFGYMFAEGGYVCRFKNQLTGVAVRPDEKMPAAFRLHQNYPNPFNPTTTIRYDVVKPDRVSLKIYNMLGEEIKTLVDGVVASGNHSIVWDATNNSGNKVASGMYIYTLKVGDGQAHRRMLLLK